MGSCIPSERGQHREEPLPPRDRRQSGASQASVEEVVVRGTTIDNRRVVPYNPYLLPKYARHMNLDICTSITSTSITSVKYLYKYVYKGHDIRHPSTTDVIEFQERGQWSSEARPATMSARRHPSAAHTNRPAPLLDTGMPHAHMRYLTEARLEAQQSEP